ncbi:hypothetical protein NQ314_013633 [Rhamnusium bicolor]|uniref:Regulatory protein zeste n=1 Tax=Rhamnusium bicolor TaxID=1586634 RepID=A0AAV8X5Y7_9CUCU|nr:hypothetical protein NQ314_013633 [Rhamnusium bicolor]
MDIPPHVNEHSNSNGDNTVKAESNETVMTFGDGLNYSDFENVEYEEVDGEFIGTKPDDEYNTSNTLKGFTRKRTRNFTQSECNMLCALLEDYSDILEIKRNDHKTNTLKNKAWSEITQKFNNSTTEEYRTSIQLRTFYENLKKKRKKLYKEVENGDATDLTCNNSFDGKSQQSEAHQVKGSNKLPDGYRRHSSFMEDYQRKKMELVEREIERVKSASDQQRKLFLLQEEKLILEIEEIKERLKK